VNVVPVAEQHAKRLCAKTTGKNAFVYLVKGGTPYPAAGLRIYKRL